MSVVDSSTVGKILLGRLLILLPIAFCAYFILESQDRSVRLAAFVMLIILAQVREWMFLANQKSQLKDNKH